MSLNSVITWMRLFKYLRTVPFMQLLIGTVQLAMGQLASFTSIFVIIIAGFTLANLLAFGGELAPYRSYEFTLYTLYRSLLGADYFDDMYEVNCLRAHVRMIAQNADDQSCACRANAHAPASVSGRTRTHLVHVFLGTFPSLCIPPLLCEIQSNRFLGPLLYISWTLIGFFLLLNMFVAILNDAIDEVKHSLLSSQPPTSPCNIFHPPPSLTLYPSPRHLLCDDHSVAQRAPSEISCKGFRAPIATASIASDPHSLPPLLRKTFRLPPPATF